VVSITHAHTQNDGLISIRKESELPIRGSYLCIRLLGKKHGFKFPKVNAFILAGTCNVKFVKIVNVDNLSTARSI